MSITVYGDLALRLAEELTSLPGVDRVRVWLRADDIVVAAAELPPDSFTSSGLDPKQVAELLFRVAPLAGEKGLPIEVGGIRYGFVEIPNLKQLSEPSVQRLRSKIEPVASAFAGATALAEAEATSRGKILVVDDDPDLCKLLVRLLSRERFDVIVAPNGRDALEVAREHQPDLILMDWIMPVLDGREATRGLKADQETAKIPVVMITSRSRAQDKIEALQAGVQDFLPKPFDFRELIARIEMLLRWRRLLSPDPLPPEVSVDPAGEDEVHGAILQQLVRDIRGGDASIALEDAVSEAEDCEDKRQYARAGAAYKVGADAAQALGDRELTNRLLRLSGRAYLMWAETSPNSSDIQRGYSLSVRRFLDAGNLRLVKGAGEAHSKAPSA